MSGRFSILKRLASFRYALAGLRQLLVAEPNARIHTAATLLVVATGLWLGLDRFEWCWIVLAIGLVWFAEALNTSIERLGDAITREQSPEIGMAKDVAAGAVLIFSVAAALIGLLVVGPHIVALMK